jgi:hypothetical protein
MGIKGQKGLLFWCFMPKGEKIKAKANGSANHILVFDQNPLIAKLFSYGGEVSLWEKEGVYDI